MECRFPRRVFSRHSRMLISLLFLFSACQLPSPAAALTATTLGDFDNVTVMQASGSYDAIDTAGQPALEPRRVIVREFYRSHGDDYDFLVIFTNFDFVMPPGARAFFAPARNNVQGIGLPLSDYTSSYSDNGSPLKRLEGTIDMANLASHALEPGDPEFDDTLTTLTHEFLHRWGAYVHFRDGATDSNALLGLADAHWSYLLDSKSSTLYGNHWRDNGDGTFTSVAPEQIRTGEVIGRIFSPLDLYLMGLVDKSQVPPLLLIDAPGIDRSQLPAIGDTIPGVARTVTIDDIIAAEGARIPSAAESRKEFRVAFIYAVIPGTWSSSEAQDRGEVAAINRLQTEWEKRFSILTDGKALMRTAMVVPETVATNPGVTPPTVTPAVTPSVNNGVSWLIGRQQPGGFWQDQPGTDRRDTAAAVAALKAFPAGFPAAASGQAWLGTVTPENSDFLARKLLGLNSVSVTELAALQNADGGWGSAPGYASNPIDTALVLQALTAHGAASGSVLTAAINYLHGSQNPDGGWSVGGSGSMVQPTARALLALNGHRRSYPVEPAIADGLAWLAGRQNGDGGFGNSPSTVIDTAIVLEALKATGSSPAITGAINYLLVRQASSGSWNGSVFQTAQVVAALYAGQVAADLTVAPADISFNPASVSVVPATVAVTATVRNLGSNAASQVKVALFESDPAPGRLLGEQTVNVPGNGNAPAVFHVTVSGYGLHSYQVIVDSGNLVLEANEGNNAASNTLAAKQPPPTVGFALSASAGSEAEVDVPLTVGLSYPWPEPITVNYTVNAASTAIPSDDYVLAAGTLTFVAGQVNGTIPLAVVNDLVAEADKTMVVDLASPSLGTLGSSRHTYTIRDDETPAVTITSPPSGLIGQSAPQLLYTSTGGNVTVKVDSAIVAKVSGNTLGQLVDGAHFVEVTAANSFGLTTTSRVDFTVDTSAPVVTILSPVTGVFPGDTLPLLYQLDGGEVNKVLLDGQLTTGRSGADLGPLSDGEHQVSIMASDSVGNTTVATRWFVIAKNGSGTSGQAELPPELSGSREIVRTSYYERGVMKPDAGGNTYFATIRYGASANYDILVYKFDRSGRLLWPAPVTLDFPFNAYLGGLEVDGCGNVYVFGKTKDTITNAAGIVVEDWDYDLFAARIDSVGTLLWSNTWGSIQNDDIYAGHLAATGNLYLTGLSDGPIDGSYGDNPGQEMFITVLDATGKRLLNANYPNPTGWAIAADLSGNIFFVDGQALRKYSPSGQLIWSMPYGGLYPIEFDRQGDLVLGLNPLQKIDPASGAILWRGEPIVMQSLPGSTGKIFEVNWLGFDDNNDIYLLGYTNQQLDGHPSLDGNDPYMVKFDRQGHKLWVKQLDSPLEGAFSGGFVPGNDLLYATRYKKAGSSPALDYVFTLDTFVLTSASAGLVDSYYLTSASACGGVSYNQGPVSVRLHSAEEACSSPDQLAMTFRGSKDMVIAYLANGGYPLATDVELAAFGNSLTLLAADSAGTATVALLEVEPANGLGVRTMASKSFVLTAGKPLVIHDLSGLSGRIAAGKTFGVKLSMSTTARSVNKISWGSAFDCPNGSRQYLRVIERSVDGQAPVSTVHLPVPDAQLPPGCSLIEGGAGDGSGSGVTRVEVSLDDGRSWHTATDTSADQSWSSWAFPWCHSHTGLYLLRSRATDRAGNSEVPKAATAVVVSNVAPTQLTITPEMITQGEPANVTLTIEHFDTAVSNIQIKLVRDVAGDGSPVNDPLVRLFFVEDGVASSDPNIPGDEDGIANGRIVTTLNFDYLNDVQMAPGDYVFLADTYPTAVTMPFRVTQTSQAQTIQGYVLDPQNQPRGGAAVQLLDKWGNSHGYAFTDAAGHYLFNVPAPGEYILLPTLENFVFARASLLPRALAAGQHLTVDLPMVAGTYKVDGQVRDAGTTRQVKGGVLIRAESSKYVAAPMIRAYGGYEICLPAGDYRLFADAYTTQGAGTQGYLGSRAPLGLLAVSADSIGNHLSLNKATALVCGQVRDAEGMGVSGLVVDASTDSGSARFATAVTDDYGNYCLGLSNDGIWQVALNDSADQPLGFVGNAVPGITAAGGPFGGVDLTVYPVKGAIEGVVREGVQPVAGIFVKATCSATAAIVTGETVSDGSYRLGVHAGTWQVAVATEPLGYDPVPPAAVAVAAGETASRSFVVMKSAQPVSVTVDPVISPTTQSAQTITGNRTTNATVTVTVNTMADVGAVSYPTSATWQCTLRNLVQGPNGVTVTATDGASQSTAPAVTIDYQPSQPLNTIVVTKATYEPRKKLLGVEATSDYSNAQLQVVGYGPMTFSRLFKGKYYWTFSKSLSSKPATVTVSGPEGSKTATVQ